MPDLTDADTDDILRLITPSWQPCSTPTARSSETIIDQQLRAVHRATSITLAVAS
jgi:hypothetical protein